MADISKITLPNDTTYNIKDKNARNFTNTPYYEQDEEALMFQLGESYMTGEQDNQPYSFRAAGGSADIGNREYDKIVGGTVAWNQLVRNEASTNETDFADIVTVDDAVEDAAGVKVKIEPVQDLHGYDSPWPAGGGKNKFSGAWPPDILRVYASWHTPWTDKINVSVIDKNNGADISGIYFGLSDNGTGTPIRWLILNGNVELTHLYYAREFVDADVKQYAIMYPATEGALNRLLNRFLISIYTDSDAENANQPYSPYSNICPITGWDGVQVWDDPNHGGNVKWNQLIDNDTMQKTGSGLTYRRTGQNITITGTVSSIPEDKNIYALINNFNVIKGHKYLILKTNTSTSVYIYGEDTIGLIQGSRIITVTQTGIMRANIRFETNWAVDDVINKEYYFSVYDLTEMFGEGNEPSTVGEFKAMFPNDYYTYNTGEITTVSAVNGDPYRHYSITLPTEAGTVYGGELTVNEDGSGSLVVDRAMVDLGTLDWGYNMANMGVFHSDGIRTIVKSNENCICSAYAKMVKLPTSTSIPSEADKTFAINRSSSGSAYTGNLAAGALIVKDNSYTSSTAFKAAVSGVQLVYELATPITYTLTASQIRTLLGTNNVWADAGRVSLSYTGTDEHLVLKSDRKYFTRISGTDSVLLGSGQEITAAKGTDNIFDLTQMFGSTIADYIYSLEQATAGAGVAWFRKLFPKPYYEYNPGELMSVQAVAHKLVGFNAWDEEWELGIINTTTGEETDSNSNIRSKNYIRVIPGATYYFKLGTTDISNNIVFYDAEKNYVAASGEHVNDVFTVPEDAHYMKFYMSTNYGSTYLSNICINLSGNGERDGEYEEYNMHSYPLDSSLILRGIPKLDENNQLYYDGDVYEADGTVTRKYGIVDLGTLDWNYQERYNRFYSPSKNNGKANSRNVLCLKFPNEYSSTNTDCVFIDNLGRIFIKTLDYTDAAAFKAAMSGVYLVYELAAPTTETAEPYDNPQIIAPEGTEEYITTNIVFVGHETKY